MSGFSTTPVSTTPLGTNQFPVSAVAVPNETGAALTALEGGPESAADLNGNKTAPASMWIRDGNDQTQGATTDTGTSNTVMGRLTAIKTLLSGALAVTGTFWQSVQPVSGTFWQATQPISAATLPLPAGAALETGGNLATVVTNTTGIATQATLAAAKTDLDTIATNIPAKGAAITAVSTPVNIASDQMVPTKGGFTEQASLSVGSLSADLVASVDVSTYKWLSLHIGTSVYNGTLSFQGSNDNTNWIPVIMSRPDSLNMVSTAVSASNVIYSCAVSFRFFRVRLTGYLSGSATGTLELYTSAAAFGIVSISNTTAVGVLQNGTWSVAQIPAASGGTLDYHVVAAATNNAANIKASAGQVYGWDIFNNAASVRYVKLFNKATAPTPGTDTPVRTIAIPAGGKAFNQVENGMAFSTGIGVCIVSGIADSDNTAITASDVVVDIDYK